MAYVHDSQCAIVRLTSIEAFKLHRVITAFIESLLLEVSSCAKFRHGHRKRIAQLRFLWHLELRTQASFCLRPLRWVMADVQVNAGAEVMIALRNDTSLSNCVRFISLVR